MRAEGISGNAVPETRGVPLPREPRGGTHMLERGRRDPLATSPFAGQQRPEFTPAQLAKAGYSTGRATPARKTRTVERHKKATPRRTASRPRTATPKPAPKPTPKSAPRPARTPKPRPRRFDHQAAVREYLAGETASQVGQRHGVTVRSVLNALHAAGHQTRPPGPRPYKPRGPRATTPVDEIVRLYTVEHLSPPEIARRVGASPKAVRENLDRAGVQRTDARATHSGGRNGHPEELLREAGRLYATGLTRSEVAARLGIGVKAVDKGIRLAHIQPRPGAHIPSGRPGRDGARGLKDLMAEHHVTAAEVRAYALGAGLDCPLVGIPPARLVRSYLAAAGVETPTEAKR
ncbi:hypothetical protein H9L10_03670 [Phycicoccus endophyticus]|uniref:Uncharacterized protein n=1 Tax=Phycicoccus endophyticus TaxID=1690220 RepID=A0A7G9R3J3_9MICO|nr:hypothetical protein [Phycicoccus endophyticus]NHI19924.1 hypothetical protein [Phycicoccus endophyticus]QNN50168.1 hypothetical protein H9L10_03670 [Phycicoccus endophyticus]GGL27486.1 hypothetical protein GCM10012283_07090 [Phycicoccus endophyticus]